MEILKDKNKRKQLEMTQEAMAYIMDVRDRLNNRITMFRHEKEKMHQMALTLQSIYYSMK